MAYKNLVDLHIHTDNSDDGFDPVSLMGEYAIKSNLVVAAIAEDGSADGNETGGPAL